MNWNAMEGTVEFNALWTTTIALLLLMLGYALRRKISFLDKYCIPAPVIGGLLMSLLLLTLHHSGGTTLHLNPALQTPMMLAFFTTVGIGGSLSMLKAGGKALIIYLCCCWGLAIFQNVFGSILAYLLGVHPLLGVMAGAVALVGGHGNAAAYGPDVESMGIMGAQAVALASATFGLIAGGFIGGPTAFYLIKKNKLEIRASDDALYRKNKDNSPSSELFTSRDFLSMMALILVLMLIGDTLSRQYTQAFGYTLPGYVGAMFVAIIFRNLNDKLKLLRVNERIIELVGDISIGIFLTMAMMGLKIWQLYDLAGPLVTILLLQVCAIVLISIFILFPLLGKDYDSAVICAGYIGHGLGATPNAVANMGAVCERYKTISHKAFLIVPLSGAVLIDLVAIPNILLFINSLK